MENTYYYTTEQARMPMFISYYLDPTDMVFTFNELMKGIDLSKYIKYSPTKCGRIGYNLIDMLKTVLFGFMDCGYISLRELEKKCKTDLRYIWLMKEATPTYKTFGNFINDYLKENIQSIFFAISNLIIKKDSVDLEHVYIDGTKLEANANKYTWVWKKAAIKTRYKTFAKITSLLNIINEDIENISLKFHTNTEYSIEQLTQILSAIKMIFKLDISKFVSGKGHKKTKGQRYYQNMLKYQEKLKECSIKINICGEDRNSYSKTDIDATFMRVKKDYMGNDQLLPAYNLECVVADEYIVLPAVFQYTNDVDTFIPLMLEFKERYGFYPKYPVADAGYGSFNNYIFCEENNIEKYMKFTMYDKEIKDKKYHNNQFRAINFKIEDGKIYCPNNKEFKFVYRKPSKNNKYGRQDEIYECEDCSNCPLKEKCTKASGNRKVNINRELTHYHEEVINNLESIKGALLRMNRSIQSEGTFGIIKQDRWYKRIVRRRLNSVNLEIFLISIGHNLYKYHNKTHKTQESIS